MGNYEPNPGKVKLRPRDSASRSSAKFRTDVANRLDALGKHGRAFRVRMCRPKKEGGYPCKDGVLCDHCRNVLTVKTKRSYTSRMLATMKDDDPRVLLSLTLTMGEDVDLDARCKDLSRLLRRIPDLSDAWSRVLGMFYFLHEERGESRRTWRPHYHLVVTVKAADFLGLKKHYRRLILAWTRAAWAVLHPSCPIPESEGSGSAFRRLLEQQEIKPLNCFQESSTLSLKGAEYDQRALVGDLSSLIEYGLKRKKSDTTHPRGPRMRPRDYVKVALRPNNKRGLKGCLRGIAPEELEESQQDLEAVASPMEAEQTGRSMKTTGTRRSKERITR